MTEMHGERELRRLTTPRAASVVGILFGLLFAASVVIFRTALPEDLYTGSDWVERSAGRINFALMPFAGIAFLWFIGVVCDKLGKYEDQFFSTVFLGSGLIFLAMIFVSMAIAGGIVTVARADVGGVYKADIVYFGRVVMFQISNVYALRMAGVFMISLGTIWWCTGLMPRWLALITYLLALSLLLVINLSLWVSLIFPAWVFVISVFKLVTQEPISKASNE